MSEEILQQIKACKQGLLNKAFLVLLSHRHFQDWYRKFGEGGFDEFCYHCHRELEKLEESAPMMQGNLIKQPIDEQYYSPEIYKQLIEKRILIARDMIQVSYKPPLFDDKESMINHLHLMWHLYEVGISCPPSIESMCLDLSFAKLLSAAQRQIASDLTKAERDETKNLKSTKTKREKAELWKRVVLAIYEHGEPIAPGTRRSEAVRMIQKQFDRSRGDKEAKWGEIPLDKEKMKTPNRDGIIKLLKTEGILDMDFENKKGYWFKKM